jgi:hypothetical protein
MGECAGMTGETTDLQRQRERLQSRYGVLPSEADHATLLRMIEDYLNEGLETQVEPFPETDREFSTILDELRALDTDELRAKLDISGWLLRP